MFEKIKHKRDQKVVNMVENKRENDDDITSVMKPSINTNHCSRNPIKLSEICVEKSVGKSPKLKPKNRTRFEELRSIFEPDAVCVPKNGGCINNGEHQVQNKYTDLKKHSNDRSIVQSNIQQNIQLNIRSTKKYSENILNISNISNVEKSKVLRSENLMPNPAVNTSSHKSADREVLRVEKSKCVVCLPNPMNGLSPQSDNKKKMTSSSKKKIGKKKSKEELCSLTPITRFFKKNDEILPQVKNGESNSNGEINETLEVGTYDYN